MFQAMLLVCAIGNGCTEMIGTELDATVEACQSRLDETVAMVRSEYPPEMHERIAFARKCVAQPSA